VANLKAVLATIRQALKPDGYLLVNEYVGPRQLQFTDAQLNATRDLLATLPERLRRDGATGGVKTEYHCFPVEHWNRVDPSEAIRSDRIVPLLYRFFDVVLQLDCGGSVLNPLLEHIVHNFDHGRPADVATFLRLAHAEQTLIELGVVANDFTVMAMRRPTWRTRLQLPATRRAKARGHLR
jgi:hypothetical protein